MSRNREAHFQVGPEMWVRLSVVVHDAEGVPVQEEPSVAEFVYGFGTLLPALEDAIGGMPPGGRRQVTLKPQDAFGERDPKAILEVLRDEFPPDVREGDVFDAEEDEGAEAPGSMVLLRVLEVTPEYVVLDRNHPLAGQKVRFDVEVLEVRPAEETEISAAEAAVLGLDPARESLIPAASLLRGPTRRYEKDPSGA